MNQRLKSEICEALLHISLVLERGIVKRVKYRLREIEVNLDLKCKQNNKSPHNQLLNHCIQSQLITYIIQSVKASSTVILNMYSTNSSEPIPQSLCT